MNKDKRREVKLSLPNGVHLMNKNEAKVMRQLKKKTGLSEEEIREVKKYRKMLSDAQDAGEIACLHKQCENCNGTGRNKRGERCIHNLVCKCKKCLGL